MRCHSGALKITLSWIVARQNATLRRRFSKMFFRRDVSGKTIFEFSKATSQLRQALKTAEFLENPIGTGANSLSSVTLI